LTLAVAYGLFFSFSVFFLPLVEEFRWSRGLTAGALSLSTVVQGLLAPVAGILADRFGPRPVILGGAVVIGTASLLAATIHAPWQLYLYTGVLAAVGLVGLGWVPSSVLLARSFSARRGRVVGFAFSGMGVGVFVIGPLAQWLIDHVGWRTATAVLGAAALVILVPLVWLGAREREAGAAGTRPAVAPRPGGTAAPASRPPGAADPSLREALATRPFWALFAAYFLTPLAVFPVFTHQVVFAVDVGFARMFAASIFGLMGLMSTVGRVSFGLTADRLGGPLAATLSFACTAGGTLSLLALETSPRAAWLVLYALLFGFGFGARGPIITAMATELFGGRRFGVIYGVLNLANGLGAAIGPWFGGAVHDLSGSYRIAFLSAVAFSALGALCFWLARGPRLDARESGVLTHRHD
jgi:MFS family permease